MQIDFGSRSPLMEPLISPLQDRDLRIYTPDEEWSDRFALNVAIEDFHRSENYRSQNHDWRWNAADEMYLGYVAQKYWEGTKVPRANIPVYVAYEQIESLMPRVMQALFGDSPWFEAEAYGRTTPEAARVSRDIILKQLDQCRIRKVFRISLRSAFTYGNGIIEGSWLYSKQMRKKFLPRYMPKRRSVVDPISNVQFDVATQDYDRIVNEIDVEEVENRPLMTPVSLKRCYADPNCSSADPRDGDFFIIRDYMGIGELKALRDTDGFDIPDDDELIEMSRQKTTAQGDNTQSWQESARLGSWQPQIDQSLDPGSGRVEVIRRLSANNVTWAVNRKNLIYNRPNPYGKILIYNAFYTDLVDRFHGLAITDVVEGEQRFQEGLINGRIDELAINLHPPTTVKRGNQTPIYQLRSRPGAVNYSDDPKNDLVRQYTNNVTAQAFQEVAASDLRVQKTTGLTDLAMIGVSSGANPGARSATGAGLQGQASFSRVNFIVENTEYDVMEVMLQDCHMLNNHHLDPDQMIEAVSGTNLNPMMVFGADVKFTMRAASRMQSRSGLLQVLPLVLQNIMNPWLQEQLNRQGKTVDFEEIMQMVLDATGYRKKASWVRQMTPQEAQALQQSKPSPEMIKMMMQDKRMDALATMQQDSDTRDIVKALLVEQARPDKEVRQLDKSR